ncbi:MAG: hypothetical protein KDD06_00760 [Phaeodactylibacter sp.]|nr:hypothetical protein [Phaeodactylibacter sp.]MCB9266721.1 hypothetical protein [Lewinellaceae bacterium]MCB9289032.1 hypothetical protein [Lewinellaceae bacterium]
MKKRLFLILSLALAAGIGLSSCNGQPEKEMGQQPTINEEQPARLVANEGEGDALSTGAAESRALVINNLQTAFAGETTASAKYAAYAKKAEAEGHRQIALLFKAASVSEKVHANNHRAVLEEMGVSPIEVKPAFTVKTTKENLQDAIAGESYEITTMYPEFLANADKANAQMALLSLNYAYKTEQKHKPLYEQALGALQNSRENSLATRFFICPTCGNTYDGAAPKRCGISMTGGERFIEINSL